MEGHWSQRKNQKSWAKGENSALGIVYTATEVVDTTGIVQPIKENRASKAEVRNLQK